MITKAIEGKEERDAMTHQRMKIIIIPSRVDLKEIGDLLRGMVHACRTLLI